MQHLRHFGTARAVELGTQAQRALTEIDRPIPAPNAGLQATAGQRELGPQRLGIDRAHRVERGIGELLPALGFFRLVERIAGQAHEVNPGLGDQARVATLHRSGGGANQRLFRLTRHAAAIFDLPQQIQRLGQHRAIGQLIGALHNASRLVDDHAVATQALLGADLGEFDDQSLDLGAGLGIAGQGGGAWQGLDISTARQRRQVVHRGAGVFDDLLDGLLRMLVKALTSSSFSSRQRRRSSKMAGSCSSRTRARQAALRILTHSCV